MEATLGDGSLGLDHLLQRAAQVDSACFAAGRSRPWHRRCERVIDLERSRRAPVAKQPSAIAAAYTVAADFEEVHWRHIEERRAVFRKVREAEYRSALLDFAAWRKIVGSVPIGLTR